MPRRHAGVVGHLDVAPGVIAHGHAPPAAPADGQALEKRSPFPGGTGGALRPMCLGRGHELGLVRLEGLPADVAGMCVVDEGDPLVAGKGDHRRLAARGRPPAVTAEEEGAGVAWVVQGPQHPPVRQRLPGQFTLVGAGTDPEREPEPLGGEGLHDGSRRSGAGEGGEEVPDGVLHAGVGVEHDPAGGVIDQPDREGDDEIAALGLGDHPATETGADEMQLGLAHGPLQPEQEPIVEVAGVIKPVLVADQGGAEGAELEQAAPVGVVAGQAGHLQAEHDPGPAHADLGHEALKALPVDR